MEIFIKAPVVNSPRIVVLISPIHAGSCKWISEKASPLGRWVNRGKEAHIKINPRRSKKKNAQGTGEECPPNDGGGTTNSKVHPARRWVVERTISWFSKRRGLRTRWAKKSENWLSFVQLACAHILLNLAVLG